MDNRTALFLGQFEHVVDDKNRLFLPARFREKNTRASFMLTQGLENCLFLFPADALDSLAAKLEQLPLSNKMEERAFKRLLLSGACETAIDSQGRILIPQLLKDYAGISKDAVIIGVLRHVEIWARDRWNDYRKKAQVSFNKAAPHLEL